MKKYKYILGCALAAVALSSCNNYDFEQNFYPHKVGLMAGTNRIYDRTTVELSAVENGTASVQLVANLSGSQMADRDYNVSLEWLDKNYRGKTCPPYENLAEERLTSPIYSEHDAAYYEECLANLREKGIELE